MEEELLPQPYRFLSKLVFEIITQALDKASQDEAERAASKTFKPPIHLPPCTTKGSTEWYCMTAKLCENHIFVGKDDGCLEAYMANSAELAFQSPPLFPDSLTHLAVCSRTSDMQVIVAVGSSQPTHGIKVIALSSLPTNSVDLDMDTDSMLGGEEGTDTSQPDSVQANGGDPTHANWLLLSHITSNILCEAPITELVLSCDGQKLAVVFGWHGKVVLFDTQIPKELENSNNKYNSNTSNNANSNTVMSLRSKDAASSNVDSSKLHSDKNQNDKESAAEVVVATVTQPQLICLPPKLDSIRSSVQNSNNPDVASNNNGGGGPSSLMPYPLVHFLYSTAVNQANKMQGLSLYTTSVSTMIAGGVGQLLQPHTLMVGWRGLNTFSTFPLQEYNPYLPQPLALPQETSAPIDSTPAAQQAPKGVVQQGGKGGHRTPTPSGGKGKKGDKHKGANDVIATNLHDDEELQEDNQGQQQGTHHMLPSLLNSTGTDTSGDIVGLGCSDGVLVIWDTVLGVPKCIFTELSNRVSTRSKHAFFTYGVEMYQKKYCMTCVGMPRKNYSFNVNIYDVNNGIKLHSIKYMKHCILKCLPTVPLFCLRNANDPTIMVGDIGSGEIIGCLDAPGYNSKDFDSHRNCNIIRLLGHEQPDPPLIWESIGNVTKNVQPDGKIVAAGGGGSKPPVNRRKSSPIPDDSPPLPVVVSSEVVGTVELMVNELSQYYNMKDGIQSSRDIIYIMAVTRSDTSLLNIPKQPSMQQVEEGVDEPQAAPQQQQGGKKPKKAPSKSDKGQKKRPSIVANTTITSTDSHHNKGLQISSISKEIAANYFSIVKNIVPTAYPLMQDLVVSRDTKAVHQILNKSSHADRSTTENGMNATASSFQSLQFGMGGTLNSLRGTLGSPKKSPRQTNQAAVAAASTWAPGGHPPPSRENATTTVQFAAEVTVASKSSESIDGAAGRNPILRVKKALSNQEQARVDRSQRVKQRWVEMKST